MASAQVVETSVANNTHPEVTLSDDHFQSKFKKYWKANFKVVFKLGTFYLNFFKIYTRNMMIKYECKPNK